MAEVEQRAGAGGFVFVTFNNACLDGDIARDEIGGDVATLRIQGGKLIEHRRIADRAVLDHFGKALVKLAIGKCGERIGIDDHHLRLVKTAEKVFAFGDIDAGFAADR